MKWFVLFFVIIFLWQGYLFAGYTTEGWAAVYYIWDKTKDFLLMLLVIYLLRRLYEDRRIVSAWRVLTFFCACRIVWEIIVLTFNLSINDAQGIKYLFYVCWACVIYILFYPTTRKLLFKAGVLIEVGFLYIKRWWVLKFKH